MSSGQAVSVISAGNGGSGGGRVYLDNAATSYPKAPGVGDAMREYAERLGASPGRGLYAETVESARVVEKCRRDLAALFGADTCRAEQVIFTLNTTDALNLAIKGAVLHELARRSSVGDTRPVHVVTSCMDHNSVLRPLAGLCALLPGRIEQTRVAMDTTTGVPSVPSIVEAIRPGDTLMVATVHASNVTGAIAPAEDIAQACANAGVLFMLDAAQSSGHLPIDVRGFGGGVGVDLLAFPGHKGLLGPLGTGGLYIRPGVEDRLWPVREGGTGSVSEQDTQPSSLPDRFESGSHNAPGLVGLGKAVSWLLERGVEKIREHEIERSGELLHLLGIHDDNGRCANAPGLSMLGPANIDRRVGVFSFVHEWLDPASIAMALESGFGVLARPGLHCAPLVHKSFGTSQHGGALRLSLGAFTSAEDIRRAVEALIEICKHADAMHATHASSTSTVFTRGSSSPVSV